MKISLTRNFFKSVSINLCFILKLYYLFTDELKHRSFLLFGSNGVQASQPVEYMVTHKELRAALLSLGPNNTSPYTTLQELGPVIERFRLFPPVYKYMVGIPRNRVGQAMIFIRKIVNAF